MYFGMFDPTIVVLIPAIIFALYDKAVIEGGCVIVTDRSILNYGGIIR